MKARIVRIGNSRGIRIPKPLLDQAHLEEEVELEVRDGKIMISRPDKPRDGWAEAAHTLASLGEDELLDRPVSTRFDRDEWTW